MFTLQFAEETPEFINRLLVKPGLTGLAQVNGGYEINYKEKLGWDINYIKNRSLHKYIQIIFMTIIVLITGKGAR